MKITLGFLFILGVIVCSSWASCWWTGCQPRDWAVRGCSHYDQDERENQECRDDRGVEGNKYLCCPKGLGPPPGEETGPTPPPTGEEFVSYEQFRDAVTKNGHPTPSHEQYRNFNSYARSQGKISDKVEAAMALAQMIHESDGLIAKKEYRCRDTQCPNEYRDSRCDRPGQYYYGRGYIQLTWCYNYGPASKAIFGDDRLLENPDQVATNDQIAWQTSFWFWGERVHGKRGVSDGKFGVTTWYINGGECVSGSPTPQKRFKIYGKVREAFGLNGEGDPSGC